MTEALEALAKRVEECDPSRQVAAVRTALETKVWARSWQEPLLWGGVMSAYFEKGDFQLCLFTTHENSNEMRQEKSIPKADDAIQRRRE